MSNRITSVWAAIAAVGLVTSAQATNYNITWLDQGPTLFGTQVPNNSNYFLPGLGMVNVSYNISSDFFHGRTQEGLLQNGSVALGPDTWSWNNHELFAATLQTGPDPLVPVPWDITYTFQNPVPAGSLVVGVAGLGQTSSFGGGATVATVFQNGTFLGDWSGGGNWGPTQYTGGAGVFSMQNSQTGAGGIDPWWNTPLGVVRIDDVVSSITVHFSHIRGDGAGANIGFIPAPGTASLLAMAGLVSARRRR